MILFQISTQRFSTRLAAIMLLLAQQVSSLPDSILKDIDCPLLAPLGPPLTVSSFETRRGGPPLNEMMSDRHSVSYPLTPSASGR